MRNEEESMCELIHLFYCYKPILLLADHCYLVSNLILNRENVFQSGMRYEWSGENFN
jgi:hypothetical protein